MDFPPPNSAIAPAALKWADAHHAVHSMATDYGGAINVILRHHRCSFARTWRFPPGPSQRQLAARRRGAHRHARIFNTNGFDFTVAVPLQYHVAPGGRLTKQLPRTARQSAPDAPGRQRRQHRLAPAARGCWNNTSRAAISGGNAITGPGALPQSRITGCSLPRRWSVKHGPSPWMDRSGNSAPLLMSGRLTEFR